MWHRCVIPLNRESIQWLEAVLSAKVFCCTSYSIPPLASQWCMATSLTARTSTLISRSVEDIFSFPLLQSWVAGSHVLHCSSWCSRVVDRSSYMVRSSFQRCLSASVSDAVWSEPWPVVSCHKASGIRSNVWWCPSVWWALGLWVITERKQLICNQECES